MKRNNHIIWALVCLATFAPANSDSQVTPFPCDSIYSAMITLTQVRRPSLKQVRSCINLVAELYPLKCQNYDFEESHKIAQMVINSRDSRSAASFIEYLRLTCNSADEGRSFELDRMLNYYPEAILRTIYALPDTTRSDFPYMMAWGFGNNYRIDRRKSQESISAYYYMKHPAVKRYAKKYASLLRQVFDDLNWLEQFWARAAEQDAKEAAKMFWYTLPLRVVQAEPSTFRHYINPTSEVLGTPEKIPSPSIDTIIAPLFASDSSSFKSTSSSMIDGRLQTAWILPPLRPKDSLSFTLKFHRIPRYAISGLALACGWQQNDSTFRAYARPRIIELSINRQPTLYIQLADTTGYQFLRFDAIPLATDSTNQMSLNILDQYKGDSSSRLAISELRFLCIDSR